MKKSLLFFATILLSLGFFAGCSDLDNDSKEASSASGGEKFCLVSGNLVLNSDSGATSSSLLSSVSSKATFASSDSRSATSSLTEYTSTLELWGELYVSAKKEGNDEVEGTITSNEDGSVSYSLKLPAPGEWTVTVRQDAQEYNNGVIIIMKGSTSLIVDDEYSAITEDITLVPDGFLSQITGEIKLAIFDNTADKKVSSLTFYCDKVLSETLNDNSLSKDSLGENGTIAFVDGKAEINLSKVMANCYEVTFLFNDKYGNTLYRCKEALTVYSGFVTDTWFGESSYIKKNGENGYQFSITDDLITKFGAEIVPSSNLMLYESYTDEGSVKYYMASDLDTIDTSSPAYTSQGASLASYCFDSKGSIYINAGNGKIYLTATKQEIDTGLANLEGLVYDRAKDNLYLYVVSSSNGTESYFMYEVPARDNFASTLDTASLKCYKFALNFTNGITSVPYAFAVHDNKFYAPCLDSESNSFFIEADISKAVIDGETGKYIITLGDSNLVNLNESFPSDVGFTDILYQDGYVYTLFKTEAYHLGTVIRYNTFTSSATMLEIPTPAKLEGKAQVFVMSNEQHVDLYSDESLKNPVMCVYTKLFSNIYAPSTDADLSSYLCGPVRFLAIKPKKLVIADDGLAFFTDDSGNLSYKNINRVVYVDLETFSIESVSETNAKFDADRESYESDSLSGADWNNQFSILGLPASVYGKKNGSNITFTNSEETGSTYFHLEIPCAD
ncbi:hypothetical protein [uncultured Treponema sp.]|uniref:hypothetical protein n=1 Tax=uncultured Treponema sp. TaxID=162155 RepID=UPI0025F73738|nr:hypothetical protein [uncultured Treponema sp.]